MKIQAYQCFFCGDIVYSRDVMDSRDCSCNSVNVYGDPSLPKCTFANFKPESIEIEISHTFGDLQRDWLSGQNLLGIIKQGDKTS